MFIGIHQKSAGGTDLLLVHYTDKQNERYFRSNSLWGKDVFAESESTRPLKKSFSTLASLASGELTQVWLIATSDKRKCY